MVHHDFSWFIPFLFAGFHHYYGKKSTKPRFPQILLDCIPIFPSESPKKWGKVMTTYFKASTNRDRSLQKRKKNDG
jgi:hypothetical protein